MKVLQVVNSFRAGGAEKLTLQFHQKYLEWGIESYVLSLMRSDPGSLKNTYSLDMETPYHPLALLKLFLFLSQPQWKDLDIIHIHLFPSQIFVPVVAKIIGLKVALVTTEHSTFNKRRKIPLGKVFDLFLYSFYTRIVCISTGTYNELRSWQPQIKRKLVTIYNGVDLKGYPTGNKHLPQKPIVISVGRIVKSKNYEFSLQAISKLNFLDFEYWIVGAGELEDSLKALSEMLGLDSKVKFLGFRDDIPNLLQQADIFLQVSLWEGFGLSVVEAMASGLPVIVSNVSGLREVVAESNNQFSTSGFLVNPLDQGEIVNCLSKLLENPNLRSQMGENGKLRASRFDIERTCKEYIELYQSICN